MVAAEVKNLANQTAKATDDIAVQISNMRSVTLEAVAAIGQIGCVIGEISGITTTIASAVEQQSAATQQISHNLGQAASGTQEITANIENVKAATSRDRQRCWPGVEFRRQLIATVRDAGIGSREILERIESGISRGPGRKFLITTANRGVLETC